MVPTTRYEHVADGLVLIAHRPEAVPDAEWRGFLDVCDEVQRHYGDLRVLVRTEGRGGPDASQRIAFDDLACTGRVRVGVLTRSRFIRGVCTAIAWLGQVEIRAYGPEQRARAARFLRLEPRRAPDCLSRLDELYTQLNQPFQDEELNSVARARMA